MEKTSSEGKGKVGEPEQALNLGQYTFQATANSCSLCFEARKKWWPDTIDCHVQLASILFLAF